MDSLTHVALGAALGVAVMGRRTALWKAALCGGLCGTLPDLDVFIDHGDPVSNMTLHRSDSHALFWLSLLAPVIAWLVAAAQRQMAQYRRWCLAVWLALVTHPLLDLMTVYGTQLARPFSSEPYAVGSIFIIDPLYTLLLLVGVVAALRGGAGRGLRWNLAGLLLSTAYLGWGVAAQQQVSAVAEAEIRQQGLAAQRVLVTPTPFNSVLWRVVVVTPGAYHEGFYSLLDAEPRIRFDRFDAGAPLQPALAGVPGFQRMAWFSRGFYKLSQEGDRLLITDLRMGLEPAYTFSFALAQRTAGELIALPAPASAGRLPANLGTGLHWLWRRAGGSLLDPPR